MLGSSAMVTRHRCTVPTALSSTSILVSIIACIDRVNISYAKLTMTQTLSWLSPEVYGFGAGIFFAGYLLLEIPGSLFAAKFSASKWISRIMFTWGIVSLCMAFVTTE